MKLLYHRWFNWKQPCIGLEVLVENLVLKRCLPREGLLMDVEIDAESMTLTVLLF